MVVIDRNHFCIVECESHGWMVEFGWQRCDPQKPPAHMLQLQRSGFPVPVDCMTDVVRDTRTTEPTRPELSRLEVGRFGRKRAGPLGRHKQRADFLFSCGMVADDLNWVEGDGSGPAWRDFEAFGLTQCPGILGIRRVGL